MRHITVLLVLLVTLASCKKYPEGPAISFRSRSERVINTWAIEKVLVNATESTPLYSKYVYSFNSDASFSQDNTYNVLTGKWALASNDDSLIVTLPNAYVLHRFKILRLKNNSMWLIEDINTSKYEWHLKSK